MQNDILVVLDAGHSTALLLLDLSAAFNITDHDILINFLQYWFVSRPLLLIYCRLFFLIVFKLPLLPIPNLNVFY